MLKQVLRGIEVGEKVVIAYDILVKTFDGDLQNLETFGFYVKPQPVLILDKDLKNPVRGLILRKGSKEITSFSWSRNPKRLLDLMGLEGGLYFTAGKLDVLSYGKGLVTSCIRNGGFKVSRKTCVMVANSQDGWSQVFRGYFLERIYD